MFDSVLWSFQVTLWNVNVKRLLLIIILDVVDGNVSLGQLDIHDCCSLLIGCLFYHCFVITGFRRNFVIKSQYERHQACPLMSLTHLTYILQWHEVTCVNTIEESRIFPVKHHNDVPFSRGDTNIYRAPGKKRGL